MAAPKKSKTATKKKSAAKAPAAKKAASKKAVPKKAAAKTATPKKVAAKKPAAKKPAAKKPAAQKPAAKKTAAKKTAAKKTAATKAAPQKAPAKRATPAATKKAATKKAASKKAASKKAASKKAVVDPAIPRPKQTVPPKPAPKPKKKTGSPLSPLLSNEIPEQVEVPKPRGTSKDGVSYTKDFDVKFLKSQRDELLARRAAELARATRLEDEATSIIEDGEMGDVQFDDEGGEGDTMVVQRDLDRLLSGQARQTIGDIDEALARIEAGTYGYSVVSGKPIPRERLEAIPETTVLAVEKVSGAGFR
ncbi:TraR/DksA family transcriptional regulator [Ilumatobacter sp.]|uniref:TraR/DksA family transcriptional regulator n=1 Tax=Ilumatobacter sp. TaxID=1967498 RepID=UPI003F6A94CE